MARLPVRWRAGSMAGIGLRRRPGARCPRVTSHLRVVHRYNLKKDLSEHVNPSATYACRQRGGLLLCTWPKGGKLSLPFVYSNEVWTGIEYQVASHLMLMGWSRKGWRLSAHVAPVMTDACAIRSMNMNAAIGMRAPFILRSAPGTERRTLRRGRQSAASEAEYRRRLPEFFSDGHRLRHSRRADGKPFLDVASGTIEVRDVHFIPCRADEITPDGRPSFVAEPYCNQPSPAGRFGAGPISDA